MKRIGFTLLLFASLVMAEDTATLRVDYYHSGNALDEMFSLHQVVVEPLPWPGHPDRGIDTTGLGPYLFEVVEPPTNEVIYSRGFGSIFGEWQTTGEAKTMNRTFSESVRFPKPDKPVRLRISKRDDANRFAAIWDVMIDPDALHVVRSHAPPVGEVKSVVSNGPPSEKVDLLFLGDGYTREQEADFLADVRRLGDALFGTPPFEDYAEDFNVWAINPPAAEAGSNRPSNGTYRYSPTGTTYDAFGAERYVLAFDNVGLREIAQHAPYEHIIILTNMETYGGGGIFNLYATVAAGNAWADYLMIHEFAHSFAALADEYYTSAAVYDVSSPLRPEPWERNVTALHDPARLKWGHLVAPGTPVPTPWPKEAFEAFQKENQARRAQLREENRPESEMNALFRREQAFVRELFNDAEYRDHVGAFEGANYQARGYYRSSMNCMMFTRTDFFCPVCQAGIAEVIRLYTDN
ncbi:MAG: M64 family metallopeptidase [Xanthomonadales bacterium]|nr:M64 family metallopeptidase [Xanthomonadales bacterium]